MLGAILSQASGAEEDDVQGFGMFDGWSSFSIGIGESSSDVQFSLGSSFGDSGTQTLAHELVHVNQFR